MTNGMEDLKLTKKEDISFIHLFQSSDMNSAFIGDDNKTISDSNWKRKMQVLKHV